jgi:NAD(P)H-hydrate epimerase
MTLTQPGDAILVLSGKGHNGDDARAMLPGLNNRDARIINVDDPQAAIPELTPALRRRPKLIVDALFGIGLNRNLDAAWIDFIERVNHAHLDVLAVDVPSGLDSETGRALPIAIRARVTVTVGAPKKGLLSPDAAEWIGQLEVASDVGLNPYPFHSEFQWAMPEDFATYPPARPVAGHKGTFGHAAIVAGSLGYHGASLLAARGAQRSRPGLITLFTSADIYSVVASQLQAVMIHPWSDAVEWSKFTAVLFGPGLASSNVPDSMREAVRHLWDEFDQPLVVDASSLGWLNAEERANHFCRVITPHPGEAARLLDCPVAEIQRDRVKAVRALSHRFGGCWVVLKGHHTMIGRSDGDIFVNSSGNSGMAQGGTGDLLAGYVTGWLAQPALQGDPLRALRYAVWEHGRAAERLTVVRENWTAEELAVALGPLHSL